MGWWHRSADFGPPCRIWTIALLNAELLYKIFATWRRRPTSSSMRTFMRTPRRSTLTVHWNSLLMLHPGWRQPLRTWKGTSRQCSIAAELDSKLHLTILDLWGSPQSSDQLPRRSVWQPTWDANTTSVTRRWWAKELFPRPCRTMSLTWFGAWMMQSMSLWPRSGGDEDKLSSWHWSLWNTPTRRCSIWSRT